MTELYNDLSLLDKLPPEQGLAFNTGQGVGKARFPRHIEPTSISEPQVPLDSLHQWEGIAQQLNLPPLEVHEVKPSPESSPAAIERRYADSGGPSSRHLVSSSISQSDAIKPLLQPSLIHRSPADATLATPMPVTSLGYDFVHDAMCAPLSSARASLTTRPPLTALSNAIALQAVFPGNSQPIIDTVSRPFQQPQQELIQHQQQPFQQQPFQQQPFQQQPFQQQPFQQQPCQQQPFQQQPPISLTQDQLHQQHAQLLQQLAQYQLQQQSMMANAVLGLDPLSQLAALASSQRAPQPAGLQPVLHTVLINALSSSNPRSSAPPTVMDISTTLPPPRTPSPPDDSARETDALARWRAMQHAATTTMPPAPSALVSSADYSSREDSQPGTDDNLHPDQPRAEPARLLAWPGGLAPPQQVRRRVTVTSASEYQPEPESSGERTRRRRRPRMAQLTDEERRRLRETNRVAARKHRERSRSRKRLTEGFLEVIEGRNEELRGQVSQLQLETQTLRNVVLALYQQQGKAAERQLPPKPW